MDFRKTIEFFIKIKGLHDYFERNGGSLENAMANANRSMDEKLKSGRDYTYSELGKLMEKLKGLSQIICNRQVTAFQSLLYLKENKSNE